MCMHDMCPFVFDVVRVFDEQGNTESFVLYKKDKNYCYIYIGQYNV